MNFLYIYRFDPSYHFDRFFHTDVVPFFEKAGHKCMAYGYRLHEAYDESIVIQPYQKETTLKELHEKFPFDVILTGTKSRMFMSYRPPLVPPPNVEIRRGCLLPPDFQNWQGIKIDLIEDYHYENDNTWYQEMKYSLILQRHYSNVQRFYDNDNKGIKCLFYPFSVDIELFKPDDKIERINKLCMASSVVHEIYAWRKMQIEKLVPLGLMEDCQEQKKVGNSYIQCLKNYIGHGCCSSIFDINPAKMWEIQASGSLLFTDDNPKCGMYEIFNKDTFVTYKRDGSDMIDKARWVINNPQEVQRMVNQARENIVKNHSHEVRIKQLVDIINKELQ